jgi:phthiocerol/phenolphthiocerol synthesis type-I polyketide synthase E
VTDSLTDHTALAGDDTAEQLTRIWQEILSVGPISLDQNYFDLGGDSSLAVQMFAQIEKTFKIKLPLATLYEAPTIEELARVVRNEAPNSRWSPLVAIQPKGSRPALFCMHPHGGNVLVYRDLSRHLGSDQPFYGLQCQGLDGDQSPLKTIEDMAALYVKEIRRVKPHGPYFLGGYCMGGTVAFEIAQQLRAAGEVIALLALFDTIECSSFRPPSFWTQSYYNGQRLMFHIANFLCLDSEGRGRFFRDKARTMRSRITVWGNALLGKLGNTSTAPKSESWVLGQIWQANFQACLDYVPQPYSGTLTDFRPARQYRIFNRPDLRWDRFARGKQEVVVLPVNAPAMLIDPFVKDLAIALRKRIDTAMSNCDANSSRETEVKTL